MISETARRILRNIHYINVRNPEKTEGDAQLSSGANILRRKVLWPWQKEKTLSENNLCKILVDLEVASSVNEAKRFVGSLDNLQIEYKECSRLSIMKTEDSSGTKYSFDLYFYD